MWWMCGRETTLSSRYLGIVFPLVHHTLSWQHASTLLSIHPTHLDSSWNVRLQPLALPTAGLK